MSKKILFSVLVLSLMSFSLFKGEKKETKVLISTEYGNIKIKLFNETPQHRDNFIKLVKEGFYNETLFHRVIKDFM
ncbi:MAG: peptidylprolyl isomerase, partial [Flavobacteriales bacterium]|nr:peptidylprolyl isomerase [Flavobacteriales bacterium]